MIPGVLGNEDAREGHRQPRVNESIELTGVVRRVSECKVVASSGKGGSEWQGVFLEYASALQQTQPCDVRLERMERRRTELHEVDARGAS